MADRANGLLGKTCIHPTHVLPVHALSVVSQRPDHLGGDQAYSSRRNRRYLRRRQIKHTIPEPKNQRANRQRRGGRPAGFDKTIYERRIEVERMINALKNSRAVATRFDKRASVFHGTVTVASMRLWLRP